MIKKILKSRKTKAILLIALAVILSLVFTFLHFRIHPDSTSTFWEILYYISQVISCLFVISGVVIAVWQYYLSYQNNRTALAMEQVQKAIDLSEYYKDNILISFPAIRYIFSNAGIADILETLKLDQLNDFDEQELKKLFSTKQISTLQALSKTDDFFRSVMEANEIYGLNLNVNTTESVSETDSDTEIAAKIDKKSVIVAFAANLLNDVLNNLEFFALHFRHNTADESVVYQSLHQSYLSIMPYMYYYIAKQNRDPSNKLYTNAIWLFIEWRNKKKIQDEQRSKKENDIPSPGTIINNS